MRRLNEILDTISRAIALTANLPISFGRRSARTEEPYVVRYTLPEQPQQPQSSRPRGIPFGRALPSPKASLADDECPLLPSEDVDRIILPRGDGLQERYEVIGGVARLTIEPEPAPASGHFSEEEIHQQAMRTQWLQMVVNHTPVVYSHEDVSDWLQAVVDRTISQRQPFRGSPPLETLTRHACLNCAYFVPGKTLCCNAFHTIEDSTAINDCADFELK